MTADQPIATSPSGARRIGLSSRGRTFIAIGLVSLPAGLMLGVLDLQRVGVLLLVVPLSAWLAVRQARSALRVGHAVSPPRIVAGDQTQVRLVLGNPHTFGTGPLRITETVPGGRPLRFSVAGVRGRQRRTVAYPLPAMRRGRYRVGPTTVIASDPFGLVMAESLSTDTAELIVLPRTVQLTPLALPDAWRDGAATLSHSVGVGGSDDASIREFRHGDDLRKIHWRSTARSGKPMVRQEERPWHGQSLVLLDTRAGAYPGSSTDADCASLEWAISAAASIGCHLAERGRTVAVVAGDGRVVHNESTAILDLLADIKPAQRSDVGPLAGALNSLGQGSVVFAILSAGSHLSLTELAVQPTLPGSGIALLLRPGTWTAENEDLAAAAEWQTTAELLRANGWRVVSVGAGAQLADLWPALFDTRARAYP
jgi:uncharacterized protein (DUF58 family)